MYLAIAVAAEEWRDAGASELVITSGVRDSAPGQVRDSLHTRGLAVDLRTWGLDPAEMLGRLARRLPRGFDLVVGKQRHLHVEWDPKPGERLAGGR